MLIMGIMTDYTKTSKLMSVLQRQLEGQSDPAQYLVNILSCISQPTTTSIN